MTPLTRLTRGAPRVAYFRSPVLLDPGFLGICVLYFFRDGVEFLEVKTLAFLTGVRPFDEPADFCGRSGYCQCVFYVIWHRYVFNLFVYFAARWFRPSSWLGPVDLLLDWFTPWAPRSSSSSAFPNRTFLCRHPESEVLRLSLHSHWVKRKTRCHF